MTIDLSQFHQVFYEESYEGLDIMESALMELDLENIDSETINAIFRAAHSIKGGSATFGFSSVSEFTHDLETILDQVRAGTRKFRRGDVDLCLQSVDCMREMLQLLQSGEAGVTPKSQELKQKFGAMLAPQSESEAVTDTADEPVSQTSETEPQLWQIHFVPGSDILKTGNDVARMFRELADLGTLSQVNCNYNLPELKSIDPECCYLSWDLSLQTSSASEYIAEVFEWVSDESELIITPCHQRSQWHIQFKPDENILRTGNEPLRLFGALRELGEIEVLAHIEGLPGLRLYDHERCFIWWDIELTSERTDRAAIEEIFEWVSDESEITIEQSNPISEKIEKQQSPSITQTPQSGKAAVVPIVRETVSSDVQQERVAGEPVVPQKNTTVEESKQNTAKSVAKKSAEPGSIRVGIDKVDNLINMVGELVITQSMLGQLGTDFDVDRVPKLLEGLGQLEQNTRELQESVMRIRMLPISFAFSRFPRMVRDLSQTLGKQLHLEMLGEQTELDKTVMEKIGDPLVHLVRNAVDHGIEMPEERIAKGKSATGRITLNAYHQGGNVVIEISDDGKGLDREKIVSKAVEKHLLSSAEADSLNDEQVFDLIFQPGFSTAHAVSDLSGRGVGMDVVKRNIQALNGIVEIRSEKDKGSTITIRLPLTLAILDGQLVRVGTNTYIFPLVSIIESLQCRREFINKVAGGCNVFKLRDDYVPIIELHKTFAVKPDTTDLDQSLIVVVECDGDKVGIVVDELLAQQQVVIKSLEQNYKRVDGISGATILGDGTVALILDIVGIVKLAGEKFNQSITRNSSLSQSIVNLAQMAS